MGCLENEIKALIDTNIFFIVDATRVAAITKDCPRIDGTIPFDAIEKACAINAMVRRTPGAIITKEINREAIAAIRDLRGRKLKVGNGPAHRYDQLSAGRKYEMQYNEALENLACECERTLEELRSRGNPCSLFERDQKKWFNEALEIADERKTQTEDLTRNCDRYGDHLNTDNRLIATAIAMMKRGPVIIFTYDDKLAQRFDYVEYKMRKNRGIGVGAMLTAFPLDVIRPSSIMFGANLYESIRIAV